MHGKATFTPRIVKCFEVEEVVEFEALEGLVALLLDAMAFEVKDQIKEMCPY